MFAPEPRVTACDPVFYHHTILAWQMLDREPVPIEHHEQLDAMPL